MLAEQFNQSISLDDIPENWILDNEAFEDDENL